MTDLITRAREAMDLEPRASRRALWGEMIEEIERLRDANAALRRANDYLLTLTMETPND
jgi:hypothetical protein